jgi:acetyltransferase-like isoleucine patch superfamily enzyme
MSLSRQLAHDWFSWPVPENVRIGVGTWIYSSFAFLHYRSELPIGVRIGSNTGIYDGTFFELGPKGHVQIGKYCTIVGAIFNTNGIIALGDYVCVGHEVTLATSAFASPRDEESMLISDILIEDNVWIGARSIILGGANIGGGSIIGAASVVDFAVPALSVVAGNPARIVKTLK